MSKGNPLAYDLRPFAPPNDLRPAANLTCAECGDVGKIHIAGFGNNPTLIEQAFVRLGWDADVHRAKHNFCRKCVAQRKIRVQKTLLEKADLTPKITVTPDVRGPRDATTHGMASFTRTGGSSPKEDSLEMKDLNAAQKTALRNELGGSFDEAAGRYLEGNSDHLVSEKTGVPRKLVVEFREMFYGAILEDPEITSLRRNLKEAKGILANLTVSIAKMETKLNEVCKKVGL